MSRYPSEGGVIIYANEVFSVFRPEYEIRFTQQAHQPLGLTTPPTSPFGEHPATARLAFGVGLRLHTLRAL
jgi:hypothetical protein